MKKKFSLGLCLLVLGIMLILPHIVQAADFPIISTQELKAKLDSGEKFLLFHALSDIEFNQGYIPGSVNICYSEVKTTDKLPQDKNSLIVAY